MIRHHAGELNGHDKGSLQTFSTRGVTFLQVSPWKKAPTQERNRSALGVKINAVIYSREVETYAERARARASLCVCRDRQGESV